MKNSFLLLLITSVLISCLGEAQEATTGSEYTPSDDLQFYVSRMSELVTKNWLEENLLEVKSDTSKYKDFLSVFRFYNNFDQDALSFLAGVWNSSQLSDHILDSVMLEDAQLVVATVLAKNDSSNHDIYREFIIDKTNSENISIRSNALLYLGDIATNKDLSVLLKGLGDDRATPAIQAGRAMIALGTSDSISALESELKKLKVSNNQRDKTVFGVLSESISID